MKKILLFIMPFFLLFFLLLGRAQFKNDLTQNESLILFKEGKSLIDFSFDVAGGEHFTNQDLQGKWTLFFIGYTFCPDICPTTLAHLDSVYPKLTAQPYDDIQIVFVSVDPNRDKAEELAEYVHYFNSEFIGVTSTHKQLWPVVQNLGLIYSIVDQGVGDPYYLVDHSASIVLINPKGEHHASFQATINAEGIFSVKMDLMVENIHQMYKNWH
ncbi:electron transport protein SCO1/SenC [Psychromonas ingrahamii 37]|uniref:Electron transport protein SCO1/SenC n=1 Tax=Psychromonas ingrahamii (strain DSM 17664 / CCUG 51855 / 37) TaxID=357804 RepID=A1SR68_PSYIN|nr:SCO family protein [Psychromonas ingrahamii]ABM01983.1 electron transport protein SCO1/SenC [Psychromonas ingrahamii 37]